MSTIIENPSITATVSRRGRPRRQYRCEYCAKSFKRSEHCIRHERTHTQEKPFVCRYCRKSYSRKDLVTRHERTLHADVHEQSLSRQRRRSDNQQEHQQATDRILDQVNVASLVPPQPSALETPPEENTGSLPEACESQNTPITAFLEGSAARRDGDALSPSTTTSSSESNAVVEQGDGASWSSPSVVAHQNSEHEKQSFNYNSHIDTFSEVLSGQPIANMATTFTNDRTNFEDPRENDQARNAPTSPGIMPSDITGLVGTIDVMELDDTGMDMALNLHSTRPNAGPDDGNNHPPLSDALIHSGLYQDEALASYFPMPNIDLDFSAFSFTPTSAQIDIMDSHDLLPTLEVNNTFQASSHANFDRIVNAKRMNPTTAHSTQAVAPGSSYSSSLLNTSQQQKKDGNIPLLLRDKPQTSFTLSLDEPGRAQLCQDLAKRLDVIDTASDIPSLKLCQGFLSSYVTSFHGHFPLLHLPSFCVSRTPSPLVLAICSIGALYRLDRRRARRYYDLASRAVSTVARPAPGEHSFVEEYCLWYVQARTLLSFYAIMSGEQDLISNTLNENGFYTMVYNKTKAALTTDDVASGRITWDHWIQHESWKRLISGLFIISTLTMVLFDVNPGFNSTRDLNFDLIDDENMWNAASSTEWKELRARQSQQAGLRRRSMMQALFDIILQGRHTRGDSEYHISAFSALVLMYAVVVHMWQRLQISHVFPLQAELPGHPGSSNHDLGPSLLDNAVQLMARCESFLQITENDHHPLESEGDAVTSLAFNCQAILRIARSMMFNTVRISLATFNPADMEASIVAFASTKLHRGPQLLDTVSKCLQGLSIPVKIGHMLIRKTAAFRWSVEHAIAAWENALLVTKWIHSIELDKARGVEPNKLEQEVLTSIVEVLEETECDVTTSVSLAAEVARTWGSFLQDVWVWDITPRMGKALEMVAQAYERANNKPRSSPSNNTERHDRVRSPDHSRVGRS